MNLISQQLLDSFDHLPEAEKQQVATEFLRRTLNLEVAPLSDETLTLSAEAIFLSLDDAEAEYEQQLKPR